MAKKIAMKFTLDKAGVKALLKSDAAMQACREEADRIVSRLGDGYEVSEMTGKNRVNVSVHAESYRARRDCMENNTLLKAVRGG